MYIIHVFFTQVMLNIDIQISYRFFMYYFIMYKYLLFMINWFCEYMINVMFVYLNKTVHIINL